MSEKKNTVLVIGSNGTLGQTFRHHHFGVDVDFAVKQISNDSDDVWFDLSYIDDECAIETLKLYDYVVNCAAITNVDKIERDLDTKNEAYKVNATGAKKLAEWCRKSNTTLIHISTDFVFDGNGYRPYIEEDQIHPINEYGETKALGEMFIRDSGCRYYIIRTAWLYSEYGDNCFTRIAKMIESNSQLNGVNDVISSPTYARDLVHFICQIIIKGDVANGIYHFTNEGVCTRYDFMYQMHRELGDILSKLEPVSNNVFKCPAKRPYCSVLSKEKARKIMGILNWQEALMDCITNYRDLNKNVEDFEE